MFENQRQERSEFKNYPESKLINYEVTTPISVGITLHGEATMDTIQEQNPITEIDPNADKLFKQIIEMMTNANQISKNALDLFFKHAVGVKIDSVTSTFYIASDSSLNMSIIKDNFSNAIEENLMLLTSRHYCVKVLDKNLLSMPQHQIITEDGMHLFSTFTFENFVVGESNKVAQSYALKTANKQHVDAENPFFLYGKPGCGKTHLSCAIANKKKQLYPHLQVKYSTGSEWLEEFLSSLTNNTTHEFKSLYRNVDLLIIDDIQYLAEAESTLKELFDTFDTLKRLQKQIIFTSDRSPEQLQLAGFPDRLTSRFYQGLVKKVESPDYDLRRAIARRKANARGVELTTQMEELIASTMSKNVRQLEGIINQVVAYMDILCTSGVSKKEAMVQAQQEVMKNLYADLVETKDTLITTTRILQEVAAYYQLQPEQLQEQGRKANLVLARNIAIYLMSTVMGLKYKPIGEALGGRDHTTIMNSLKKIRTQIEEKNEEVLTAINIITHRLENSTPFSQCPS